jgi:hypothetical protein
MPRPRLAFCLLVPTLLLPACSTKTQDTRTYPNSAFLTSSGSAFIVSVDGRHAPKKLAVSFFGSTGGNEMIAPPGTRKVTVVRQVGGDIDSTWHLNLTLAAGQRYEFRPDSLFNSKLEVRNLTANRTWLADPKHNTLLDPQGKSRPFGPFTP